MIWGLVTGGESGVQKILEILKEELELTMALSGLKTLVYNHGVIYCYTKLYLRIRISTYIVILCYKGTPNIEDISRSHVMCNKLSYLKTRRSNNKII